MILDSAVGESDRFEPGEAFGKVSLIETRNNDMLPQVTLILLR
jgi:hypothetical protein